MKEDTAVVILGIFIAFVALAFLYAVPVLIAWNVGVVGAAKALHTPVDTISFWNALGLSFVVGTLSRIFTSNSLSYKKPNAK